MEPRTCSQSHFIATIRGGEVIKIPSTIENKKGPKFRSLEEIYFFYDSNSNDSLSKFPHKVNRSLAMPWGLEKVKTEVESQYTEEDNELDLNGLTLRQFKKICKSRKRKASTYVNLTTIKQEDSDLQSEVDEVDLKETLGSWKQKVKKTKSKKKGVSICCSKDNKPANLALQDISSEICTPLKIKVEDEYFSEPQIRSLVHEPEILTTEVGSAFEDCIPEQDLNFTSGNQQKDFLDQFSHLHLEQPVSITNTNCCLNQASYEHLDNVDPQNPLISVNLGIEETIKKEDSVVLSEKHVVNGLEPITALLEADGSSFQNDHSLQCPFQSFRDGNGSCNVDSPRMALYSDCQDAVLTNPSEVSMDDDRDIEVGRINATNFIHSIENPTVVVEDKQLMVLDVTTEGVPASPTVEIGRDAYIYTVEVPDENSLTLANKVESQRNVTSTTEDKQSSVIDTSIATLTCSTDIQPCIGVDQSIGSAASEGLYERELEQQPPERLFSARKTISPYSKEKLCRAMLSSEMQDDTQILFSEGLKATACEEKLFLEQNAVDTSLSRSNVKKPRIILTSKRLQALRMTQMGPNKQTLKKGKTEKKLSDIKGTVNSPHVSSSSAQGAKPCSSSASCYQNAIAFSQQQMVDTERLATRLMKELQMMKEMVVDTLHSDSRTCSTSRLNTDKARIAVENVKKVEDATTRLLSTMTRDCIRFCKIMELSERRNASLQKSNDEHIPDPELCQNNLKSETKLNEIQVSPPKISVHKERKIKFADEAGENLCHIKSL